MKKLILGFSLLLVSIGVFSSGIVAQTVVVPDQPDPVVCNCGLIWGTGCKADNYGARCNDINAVMCYQWDSNCSN